MGLIDLYNVQIIDFHTSERATHTINDDGSYTIFINARLSRKQQQISYKHELEHIYNQDLHSCLDADEIEYLRH